MIETLLVGEPADLVKKVMMSNGKVEVLVNVSRAHNYYKVRKSWNECEYGSRPCTEVLPQGQYIYLSIYLV